MASKWKYFPCFLILLVTESETRGGLQDMPTNVLQRHIKVSRHHPFCVVFRDTDEGSKLEKIVNGLWQDKQDGNYSSWQFASFRPHINKMPPKNAIPDTLPAVRCYLGETSSYQYLGEVKKPDMKNWLNKLSSLYAEQNVEVSSSRLREVQLSHRLLLLAFPDGTRHHEVEDMIFAVAGEFDSCKAMAVHLTSPEVSRLRQRYGVNRYPSVVVIHNTVVNETVEEDVQVFTGQDVNRHVIKVYIEAKSVLAPSLNMESFELLMHGDGNDGRGFIPSLVCFYAHWAKDVHGYLHVYNETVALYQEDAVNMKFGLIDLAMDSSKKVVSRHLKSGAMKFIPFLVLFYQDRYGVLKQQVLHIGRPYPWSLYQALDDLDLGLIDLTGLEQHTNPWNTATFDQFSGVYEGPNGTLCQAWSHNMTDSTPHVPRPASTRIIKKPKPEPPKTKTWHDLFDTDELESKLTAHAGIPLVTMDTWSDIVEKSHAPRHIFYSGGKWAGEVTKVSMVVFIMADCGNCRRNNQTFLAIQKAVAHIDGGAMYYVNCTSEPLLCRAHNIRGFPVITAFRGLGWMDTSSCLTRNSQKLFNKFVRLDYHGVIKENAVMSWFSRVADRAVTHFNAKQNLKDFQEKGVRVLAKVRHVKGTALDAPWSYTCLRLLCERLYSIVECYSYHDNADASLQSDQHDMEVVQLTFERRDGVKATIMQQGQSLHETLENPHNTQLHRYHKEHNYEVSEDQRCEDDEALCTDVITQFILDHSRLPVTSVTSDLFHTSTSFLKEEDLPILLALAYQDNLTQSAQFQQDLLSVAYEVYNSMIVMTLDVNQYSAWATQFVPFLYGHTRVFSENSAADNPDPLSLFVYPRLCIVRKSDHRHAALYPPITRPRLENEELSRDVILQFVLSYQQDPENLIIETEHF